jgi:hypothetical protein
MLVEKARDLLSTRTGHRRGGKVWYNVRRKTEEKRMPGALPPIEVKINQGGMGVE